MPLLPISIFISNNRPVGRAYLWVTELLWSVVFVNPIHTRCHHEIGLVQSVDFVCPHFDPYFPPLKMYIRVVPLLFGKFSDLVRELKRITEILERVLPFQMMTVYNLPDIVDFSEVLGILFLCEWFVI